MTNSPCAQGRAGAASGIAGGVGSWPAGQALGVATSAAEKERRAVGGESSGDEGGEREKKNVLGGLLGMTVDVGREDELAMLMLEERPWRYSGGMLAMGRDGRRRWVEEEEEETDEARRLV